MPRTITATMPSGSEETLEFDAVITEDFADSSSITEHPVEEGSNIADHSRPESPQLQLHCVISNTPLLTGGATRRVTQDGFRITTSSAGPASHGSTGRAENAHATLLRWKNAGALLRVPTTLGPRDSMGIEAIGTTRQAKDIGGLRFTLRLKQIKLVRNKLTRVTVAKDVRAGGKVKTGQQTMVFTEEELYGKQSALDKGYEAVKQSLDNGVLKGFMGAIGG